MADILGREARHYDVYRAMMEDGSYDSYVMSQRAAGHVHDFDAYFFDRPWKVERAEADAHAVALLTANNQAVMAMMHEVLYLGARYGEHIPVVRGVPEGAESYLHRTTDMSGESKFLSQHGTEAEVATAWLVQEDVKMDIGGIDAVYAVDQMRNALFTGFPLDDKMIKAAMVACVNHIDVVALQGDAEGRDPMHAKGLINQATGSDKVTLTTLTGQTFASQTAQQIVDIIQDAIETIVTTTKSILPMVKNGTLCITLPTAQFMLLNRVRYSVSDLGPSIATFISENNGWSALGGAGIEFKQLWELDGAGGSNADRMIVYIKDPEILEMAVSIEPRRMSPGWYQDGRHFKSHFEYKVGPLFVGRPNTMHYVDGI